MLKKLMLSLNKILKFILLTIFSIFYLTTVQASNNNFDEWLITFKKKALKNGISQNTINTTFENVKFLDQVIKYDRKQPEFFEDTITYVTKRATKKRAKKAKNLLKKNHKLFNKIENEFNVESEILLSLWGVETNFGEYVGKMDIVSSLATLSYDKRRSAFFSMQLITLLKLIDKNLIDKKKLYGSWAGAYGNFQFMPTTIKKYAIDYDKNKKIELKNSLEDSVASAANYINKIGWKKKEPCFYRVRLKKEINKDYINTSAKKLHHKFKISKWKKMGVISDDIIELKNNYKAALILPDNETNSPAFLVFSNYEKILNWNRSLRFGISICTLSQMIKS